MNRNVAALALMVALALIPQSVAAETGTGPSVRIVGDAPAQVNIPALPKTAPPAGLPKVTIVADAPVAAAAAPAAAASAPAAAAAAAGTYVVRRGDTLSGIAQQYGISLSSLMRSNGIGNADLLATGQRLTISSATGAPAVAAPGPKAPAASGSAAGKSIYVSIGKQRAYAYEGDKVVYSFIISTGIRGRETAPGNYRIKSKIPEAWASLWALRMPYWMGIYDVGAYENGFHALPINRWGQTMWGGLLGRPASFGCVVLSTYDAAVLYNWAPVGTPVTIRY